MTRARDVASALSGALSSSDAVSQTLSNKTIDGNDNTIKTKRGGTSSRPSTPTTGTLYYNTDDDKLQIYDAGWTNVSQDPAPLLTSITPSTAATTGTSITISGSYIKSGASVKFIGTDGTERSSASVTVNSSSQVVATTPELPVAYEPYDVKLINSDGQNAILSDVLDAGGTPTWSTSAGSLGTIAELTSFTLSVSASDPDGTSIVYSSANLPAWMSLNSSTGALTGTSPDVNTDTTYNFNITATDGVNTSSRAFSVIVAGPITAIGFGSNSQASTASYTGQDGITRAAGKTTGGPTYHGVLFNKCFPSGKDFELIVRCSYSSDGLGSGDGNPYIGLGLAVGTGYTDANANHSQLPGDYYGYADAFPNVSGDKYYNYYNTNGESPPNNAGFPLFLKFVRSGNTFNAYWGNSYSSITTQVGQVSLPYNVSGKDVLIAIGEASSTNYYFIEKFTMAP